MFDKITYISDESCKVKLKENAEVTMNLMNLHIIKSLQKRLKVTGQMYRRQSRILLRN